MIIEGILAFHDPRIRDLIDLKIFVHVEPDEALCRRLLRDIGERGRSYSSVLLRYNRFVRVDFKQFIKPTMKYAHLIVPSACHHENTNREHTNIALNVILNKIKDKLNSIKSGQPGFKEVIETSINFKEMTKPSYDLLKMKLSNVYFNFKL